MEMLRIAVLLAATVTMGIGAGVYLLYSFAIMPGLRRVSDRTFVGAFQQIDKAIVGPFLLIFFFGPLILTILAGALHLGQEERSVLPWIGIAFILQLAILAITLVINVPLNNGIKAAGNPDTIDDISAVRQRFDEARWGGWNLFRSVTSTVSVACLAWALVLIER